MQFFMAPRPDERTPMLQFPGMADPSPSTMHSSNYHLQFCAMVGMPPMPHPSLPKDIAKSMPKASKDLLYPRAIRRRNGQSRTYLFTASLANSLLLSQVVLGATVTALGASDSSRVLITLFGALNTIIAGVVAYLKSRGQPMRARMYSEDLDRLVDEIENSAIMFLGIAADVHGYDAIDTDNKVTVRGEIARLNRMWDTAIRRNVANDPDMYASGAVQSADTEALRSRGSARPTGAGNLQLPVIVPTAPPAPTAVPDMPAAPVAPVEPTKPTETPAESTKPTESPPASSSTPAEAVTPSDPAKDPAKDTAKGPPTQPDDDTSPATAPPEPKKSSDSPTPAPTAGSTSGSGSGSGSGPPPASSGSTTLAPPAPSPTPQPASDPDASPASAPLEFISSAKRTPGGESSANKANEAMKRSGSNA